MWSDILLSVRPHIETLDTRNQRGFAELAFAGFQGQPASHSNTNALPHLVAAQYINGWCTAGDRAAKPELGGLHLSDPGLFYHDEGALPANQLVFLSSPGLQHWLDYSDSCRLHALNAFVLASSLCNRFCNLFIDYRRWAKLWSHVYLIKQRQTAKWSLHKSYLKGGDSQ